MSVTNVYSINPEYALQDFQGELLAEKDKGQLAFILGNGINRYNPNDLSWNALIARVWAKYFKKDSVIPLEGISLTELYDMITINAVSTHDCHGKDRNREMQKAIEEIKKDIRGIVKEDVCRKMDYHKWLQDRLTEWNVPVLTTNYDANIETKLKQFVIPSSLYSKGYSDAYLFNVYYADKPIDGTIENEYYKHFAVWHINGRVNHLRSIRIGMSDYMNLLVATKDILHKKAHLYNVSSEQRKWGMTSDGEIDPTYTFTWLNIFYNSSICINGLGLNQDESFLRWLLISRRKYIERIGLEDVKGWYICHSSDLSNAKRLFLDNVGLKIVPLDDSRDRYEKIFEIKET